MTTPKSDPVGTLRFRVKHLTANDFDSLRDLDEGLLNDRGGRAVLASRVLESDALAQRFVEEHATAASASRYHDGFGAWLAAKHRSGDSLVRTLVAEALEELRQRREAQARAAARAVAQARQRRRAKAIRAHVSRESFERVASSTSRLADLELDPIPDLSDRAAAHIVTGRCAQTKTLAKVLAWARTMRPMLVLAGPWGIGKSFAAAAWLAALGSGFYVRAEDLGIVRARALGYSPLEGPLREVLRAPRLVVDELGYAADGSAEQAAMFELVSSRPSALTKTLVLTNKLKGSLPERLGERTWSRVRGLADIVMLDDVDLRATPPPPPSDDDEDVLVGLEGLAEALRESDPALLSGSLPAAHNRKRLDELFARGFTLSSEVTK